MRVCDIECIQSPDDLHDLKKAGELAEIFPQKMLLRCVEGAIRADGGNSLVKIEASRNTPFVHSVGGPGTMGDGWANDDHEAQPAMTLRMDGLSIQDPRAGEQRGAEDGARNRSLGSGAAAGHSGRGCARRFAWAAT